MSYKSKGAQRAYQRRWIAARRKKYLKPCEKCGSKKRINFHHLNPETKLSHKIWSWKVSRLERELLKCVALCRDYHSKHHGDEKREKSFVHGTLKCYKTHGAPKQTLNTSNLGV